MGNPDVITLQELDHHYDFMLPELRAMGYDGIFQPKHNSKGAEFNGGLPDGVAIFWNTQRIRMVNRVPVGWKDTGSLHDAGGDLLKGWEEKISENGEISYYHAAKKKSRSNFPGTKNLKQAKQVAAAVQLQI